MCWDGLEEQADNTDFVLCILELLFESMKGEDSLIRLLVSPR